MKYSMGKTGVLILLCSVVIVAGCAHERFAINMPKSEVRENVEDISQLVPNQNTQENIQEKEKIPMQSDKDLLFVNMPTGFVITEFAQVENARSLAIYESEERNVVFVGNKDKKSVYAVIDNDKDYRGDQVIELANGLTMPNGVVFDGIDLYVAEETRIIVFRNIVSQIDDGSEYAYQVFLDGFPTQGFMKHGRKYLAQGPDGNFYMSIGSPCNVCETEGIQGTIIKIDKETKEQTIVAQGVRNSVGFDRDPANGDLRFTDNGRDLLGNDIPQDELNHVTTVGQNFGFPYCHAGDIQDPKFNQFPCSDFIAPFAKLGPHVAALGMTFYEGTQFPSSYRNQIFIAEHGSWNRTIPIGYRITMVDKDTGTYQVFADGWLLDNGKQLGRPVDIKQFADGSLLVSDDSAGKLYRISYTEFNN